MAIPPLPSSDDARFQEALTKALAQPHDVPAEHASDDAVDLDACKRELMAALEWASRNRDKWMRLCDPAPVREERAREGGLANDARVASAAQSETVAGLAAEEANDRLETGNAVSLTSPSAHAAKNTAADDVDRPARATVGAPDLDLCKWELEVRGPELVDAGHRRPARSSRAAASRLAAIRYSALRRSRRRGLPKTPTCEAFLIGRARRRPWSIPAIDPRP